MSKHFESVFQLYLKHCVRLSIYYGSDMDEEAANEVAAKIEEQYPDLEVEVNDGGQPIYYYIISIE